ncbi:MAG TPA: methyltransferase [Bacteroidia bacterium]|nr:methyltransferase [Bacteroidia bacterium]HNS13217.1 methyltransferase [Bacteroidia bacterium]
MSDQTFRFKQFTVHQDKCAMKVGTDAVLLGSWLDPSHAHRILDIGTGTGIIALMLAQRSTCNIDGVDIDENACLQARENFRISPWFLRMHVFHQSFQELAGQSNLIYDLIVSNPPYFHHASKPFGESRLNARHNDLLGFQELIDGVKKILHPEGKFYLILPAKEGHEFMDLAHSAGLFCTHLVKILTKPNKPEKRLIMEFSKNMGTLSEEEIIIQNENNSFTDRYITLTNDYYIALKNHPPTDAQS